MLVWQWGRFGSGPRIAALLAEGLRASPGVRAFLCLSAQADILASATPPACDLPVRTYDGLPGFVARVLSAPLLARTLTRRIRDMAPDLAICALPGPMDLVMAWALQRAGVPFVVIVHDADPHPGDGLPFLMWLQRRLCRSADAVAALSTHVGARLTEQGLFGSRGRALIRITHPPLPYPVPDAGEREGPLRLLFFGRLLAYKGIDLLDEALEVLGPRTDLVIRVVGSGPESPVLDRLRTRPGITVENRWVAEDEVGAVIAWADALVLPYREASQSGVAAAALAAGRAVVATTVGGLSEQLAGEPGAVLCPPTAAGVAAAIRRILHRLPRVEVSRVDPQRAWQEMAESLLRQAEPLVHQSRVHVRAPRATKKPRSVASGPSGPG
ncbi:MAG: glycosyltransferase [Acetobacteraceae bacterium]